MLPGIQEFRTAQVHLANHDLEQAAEHAWKAMFYRDTWPDLLVAKADALLPLMFKTGPIQATVRQMSASDRVALRRQLRALIDDALRADGDPQAGRPPQSA